MSERDAFIVGAVWGVVVCGAKPHRDLIHHEAEVRYPHGDWRPATEPPEMLESDFWPQSVPVLGYLGNDCQPREFVCDHMRIVSYEQVDSDDPPEWFTRCSERWNVTKHITHWRPLPTPPPRYPSKITSSEGVPRYPSKITSSEGVGGQGKGGA